MSNKKKKYYVVWVGRKPGIYPSWEECKVQIDAFPGAKYKSYKSLNEAESAFQKAPDFSKKLKIEGPDIDHIANPDIENYSWCVDAACSGNPGKMEYRGVDLMTGKEIFRIGPFLDGTNNIGEFLGIIHAAAKLDKLKDHKRTIYTDSKTAMSWIRKGKSNSKLKASNKNKALFELVDRANIWLKSQTIKNPILKWDTEKWGEIPADFGRK